MMGLYYLFVIAVWLVLTCLMLFYLIRRVWRGIRQKAGVRRNSITACLALVTLAWLAASFWYGGGRKYYYDAEVNRLCTVDGGIKVYETVKLPPEKFNERGQVNFYHPAKNENALGAEYIYEQGNTYYRKGDPDLFRIGTKIIRRSDEKILGESAFYIRRGGDFPGPLFPSSFSCPFRAPELIKRVFISTKP